MIYNQNTTIAFNDFDEMPLLPYKIIENLVLDNSQNAEDFWKVLKYSDVDCLNKPNLTTQEKFDMIWSGDSLENKYSVFMKPLIGSSTDNAEAQTQLRLYRYDTMPTSHIESIICFESDFITNEKASLVKKDGMLVERTDLMESLYLSIMNGRDIEVGSGFITFDRQLSRSCKSQLSISNSKSFYGRSLIMGLNFTKPMAGGDKCG